MRATTHILGALAFVVAGALLAQGTVEVIALKHRTAEQVIPLLAPMVEPGGAVTGQYSQLIVRTSPANLAELRAALTAIDVPLRNLVISVRHDTTSQASRRGVQARGSVPGGVGVQVEDSRRDRAERVDQRIRVLEGGRAFIATGASRVVQRRDGTVVQEASTGFEVVPRLSGETVLLEIAPQRESLGARGGVRGERSASTVSGRLGEWIDLGGTTLESARDERGVLLHRERRASSGHAVQVRVDLARD